MNLEDDALAAARAAARTVAGKYAPHVDYEDVLQDAVVWLLEHANRIDHARLDNGDLYLPQLISEILTPLARRAKAEKRRQLGMDPKDQVRYQRRIVEAALPVVWDSSYRPTPAEESAGRSRPDPALRGNWEATAVDVKRAVAAVCTQEDERLLFVKYGLEAKTREAAWLTKTARDGITGRTEEIVRDLVNWLNDDLAAPEVPSQEDYTGTREVISNAQAYAISAAQYGG